MWRILGIVLNPLGALFLFTFGWIGRKIDGWLSPVVGLLAALLVALWALSVATSALYAARTEIGRAVGVIEPPAFTRMVGRVEAILSETSIGKNRVRQELLVSYPGNNSRKSFEGSRRSNRSGVPKAGDDVIVYIFENEGPRLDAPNEPALDIIMSIIATGLSLLVFYWAWRYSRHRWRIFDRSRAARQSLQWTRPQPSAQNAAMTSQVVMRGSLKPLSTAERLKADAEKVRQVMSK